MNIFINIILWIAYVTSLYFTVFLLLVYIDKRDFFRKEEKEENLGISEGKLPKEPFVSVLVPAYNEENTIIRTLKSINNLDYPKDKIEVIVINDGSKDHTEEVVSAYIRGKANFRLISHQNKGKAASLNVALKEAKGEIFACLDADSFVDTKTLKKMLHLYYKESKYNGDKRNFRGRENRDDIAIITPAMKVHKPNNILQKIQWLEYLVIILVARISSHLDSLYVAPGPFSLYRTEIIRKLGGFDDKNITEDQEIAYRVQKHQYKIKHCFNGYVYTTAPRKIKPFYAQRRRWYLGSLMCIHKYREMVANRKYGDFGIMQMAKNTAGYLLAITGIAAAAYLLFLPILEKIKNLFLIRFNILPYLTSLDLNIKLLDLLLADFRKGFIIISLFVIGIYFFYIAHRNANEKMTKFGLIPLIPYFAFYYLLKGAILLLSLFEFTRSKKIKW